MISCKSRVSVISGTVSKHSQVVTFHYTDGTETVYASPNPSESPPHQDGTPTAFRLHADEHIVAVRYKHKLAALKQIVLGCGIEFETSFGRSLVLCGRPDPFFVWGHEGGPKHEWRASPGRSIVGLCLDSEWEVNQRGALIKVLPVPRLVGSRRARVGGGGGGQDKGRKAKLESKGCEQRRRRVARSARPDRPEPPPLSLPPAPAAARARDHCRAAAAGIDPSGRLERARAGPPRRRRDPERSPAPAPASAAARVRRRGGGDGGGGGGDGPTTRQGVSAQAPVPSRGPAS